MIRMTVLFLQKRIQAALFTLSSLMACPGKQLAVLVFAHFLPTFFNYAAQLITSSHRLSEYNNIGYLHCPSFFITVGPARDI